jgi:hypothetical protein
MISETKFDGRKLLTLVAVWTAFGVFFGTQSYIREIYFGRPASLPGYIVSWICCGYSWAILTVPVLLFARRLPLDRLKWPRFLIVHTSAAVFFSLVQLGIYLCIARILFASRDRGLWDFYEFLIANEFQSSVLVYFAIVSAITVHDRLFNYRQLKKQRERQETVPSHPPTAANGSNGFIRRIPVKESGKIVLVDTDKVIWIESYGNYVFLHTAERRFLYRETMAAMEKKLDPEHFVRIRRSTIVKVDQIKELHPTDNGEFEIVLSGGSVVVSTRRYRKHLESVIKP